jgi:hypothetical protein
MIRRIKVEAFGNDPSEIEYDAIQKARKFFGQETHLFVGDYDAQSYAGSMTNRALFTAAVYVSDHDPEAASR